LTYNNIERIIISVRQIKKIWEVTQMKKLAMSTAALASLTMMVGFASAAPAVGQAAPTAHTNIHIKNNSTPTYQSGVTPSQMKTAYGVNLLSNNGAGQTIAIVDAYGSPTIQNDLNAFDAQFGLPNTTVTVANPGGTPATDGGWALETALDVEWAHSIAPSANILLVQAKTSSITDLVTAIDYATSHGAVVVSNSWGGSEWSGETAYETHFQKSGIVTIASAGDTGGQREWPAVSPSVLSVGGTTLSYGTGGSYSSESAWASSGGGKSVYFGRPSYQSGVSTVVGTSRGVPDVAMDADPNSGAAVYSSTPDSGQTGWFQVGGTSLSAPMWAGLVALADQNRSSKLSNTTAITDLYNMSSSNFHDITTGSNGNPAKVGYDLVTGLGSPKANVLIPAWTSAP
jgi:subtilase family serine protease